MPLSPFIHTPFDRSLCDNGHKHQPIRLWKFDRSSLDGELKIQLRTFEQNDVLLAKPQQYIALSYAWGPTNNTRTLLVNDGHLQVTKNLWEFLLVLVLNPKAESPDHAKWYWADQICINQSDIGERSYDVNNMWRVYRRAAEVFAYLGPECPHVSQDIMNDFKAHSSIDLFNHSTNSLLICRDLFNRAYWTRLWIVQELVLAKSITFWVGSWNCQPSFLTFLFTWRDQVSRNIPERVFQHKDELAKSQALTGDMVDILLRTHSWGSGLERLRGLESLLEKCRYSFCTDPCDRVFVIQAIVKESQTIDVDYTKSLEQVSIEVARVLVAHKLRNYFWWAWSPKTAERFKGDVHKVPEVLAVFGQRGFTDDVRALAWSVIMRGLIQGDDVILEMDHADCVALWDAVENLATTSRQTHLMSLLHASMIPLHEKHNTIIQLAEANGFVMFDDYMAHPDDWPFCGDQKSMTITEFRDVKSGG